MTATPTSALVRSRILFIISWLLFCWMAFQLVHELGHVLGACSTGAKINKVIVHPLTISQTIILTNPKPLIVIAAGPVLGSLIPLCLWFFVRNTDVGFLARNFAGFCMIGNGIYIAVGSLAQVGDAAELVACGSPAMFLVLAGFSAAVLGLFLWNGQSPCFGIGPEAKEIKPSTRLTVIASAVALYLATAIFSPQA